MVDVVSSQSNASTGDDWRLQFEEIMRRLGSMEKSTIDPVDLSPQGGASRKESKGRTLFLKIHLLRYSISWEELDCLFARFGRIECIEVFCPGEQYHSRIRFQQKESAIRAFESFNHRDIYDGCCRLELFLEAEIDDGFQEPKNWTPPHISEHRSTTASSSESWERRMRMQENLRRMEALVKKLHREPCRSLVQASTEEDSVVEILDEESELAWVEEIADKNQEITPPLSSYVDSTNGYDEPFSDIEEGLQEIEASGVDKNRMGVPIADQKQELTVSSKAMDSRLKFKSPPIEPFSRGTFSNPSMILSQRDGEFLISDRLSSRLNKLHKDSELGNSWIAMEFSETLGSKAAHNVFVVMLETYVESLWGTYAVIGKPRVLDKNLIFDPGIRVLGIGTEVSRCCLSNDPHRYHCKVGEDGCSNFGSFESRIAGLCSELRHHEVLWPYDRGKKSTGHSTILVIGVAVATSFTLELSTNQDYRIRKVMSSWVDLPPVIAAVLAKQRFLDENFIFELGIASFVLSSV